MEWEGTSKDVIWKTPLPFDLMLLPSHSSVAVKKKEEVKQMFLYAMLDCF